MTLSRPPAGHRQQRPDQPGPGHRTLNGLAATQDPDPERRRPGQAAEQVSGKPAIPPSRPQTRIVSNSGATYGSVDRGLVPVMTGPSCCQ